MRFLALSLMVATLGAGSSAAQIEGGGFGVSLIFNNLISSPRLVAATDCPDFGIVAGESLTVTAQESFFEIEHAATRESAFSIAVPLQGDYVWEGTGRSRSTTVVYSESLGIGAWMEPVSTAIVLTTLREDAEACVLRRCPGFGVCQ
jgi:hypothetical protein